MPRPGMSDGRCFTQYSPSCEMNNEIQKLNKIETNAEYRKFLQVNTDNFISQMRSMCKHSEQMYCSLCQHKFQPAKQG